MKPVWIRKSGRAATVDLLRVLVVATCIANFSACKPAPQPNALPEPERPHVVAKNFMDELSKGNLLAASEFATHSTQHFLADPSTHHKPSATEPLAPNFEFKLKDEKMDGNIAYVRFEPMKPAQGEPLDELKLIRTDGHWAVDLSPLMEKSQELGEQTLELIHIKQVGLACKLYLDDHQKFPPTLDDLYPKYMSDRSMLLLCELLLPNAPEGSFGDKQMLLRGHKVWKSGKRIWVQADMSAFIGLNKN